MIDIKKKYELLDNFKLLRDYIEEIPTYSTCLDCEHWDHQGDKCVKFNMKPPATVIVNKCDDFTPDIPF